MDDVVWATVTACEYMAWVKENMGGLAGALGGLAGKLNDVDFSDRDSIPDFLRQ